MSTVQNTLATCWCPLHGFYYPWEWDYQCPACKLLLQVGFYP
jgi:hypothetical protein